MSNADRSISLHAAKGSQNNEWKFSVHNAVKNDNISKNDLVRKYDQNVEVRIGMVAVLIKNFKQSDNASIVLSTH